MVSIDKIILSIGALVDIVFECVGLMYIMSLGFSQ